MAFRRKNPAKISQYKTKQEMNIGILIFALIFLYLIITVFTYATSKRISTYEVRKGSIVKDNSYTGLILSKRKLLLPRKQEDISAISVMRTVR